MASRLDEKKNHLGLVKAYAKSKELQDISNLCISLRGIENAYDDYLNAKKDEIAILDNIMNVIKENNLLGKVMFVSINSQFELADTYRYMARRKSIFSLTALYEPFGLAPIEAMNTGLPVAVTKYGGPSEVLKEDNESFGVLLDVLDDQSIIEGLIETFRNYDEYQKKGYQRVQSKYTWRATAEIYLEHIQKVRNKRRIKEVFVPEYFYTLDKTKLDKLYIKKILSKEVK